MRDKFHQGKNFHLVAVNVEEGETIEITKPTVIVFTKPGRIVLVGKDRPESGEEFE